MSHRLRWRVVTCALITLALMFALAAPALAFTVSGGTAAQRALVTEAIDASWVPVAEVEAGVRGVEIELTDHYPPYWELPPDTFVDVLHGAVGLAWPGHIIICAAYAPVYDGFLVEIAIHEWSHQDWFGWTVTANRAWTAYCTAGIASYDAQNWYTNPAECWAENSKMVWDAKYRQVEYPRTNLRTFTAAQTRAWRDANVRPATTTTTQAPTTTTTIPPTTTTTTAPPTTTTTLPFSDLADLDQEGKDAVVWCAAGGLVLGYPDGTFGPYNPLLVRHVSLIALRALLSPPIGWDAIYSPAIRGDVATAFPNLVFLEERWDEQLSRSQLARLLYRDAH